MGDRDAVLAAIRAAIGEAIADQSRAEQAARQAASAILGRMDDAAVLELLRVTEDRYGRRQAVSRVARKLADDPLDRETLERRIRRLRQKADNCPVAAPPSQ